MWFSSRSRVEGEGAARITDVIFNTSTVTKETVDPQEEGTCKREHEKMVEEIGERQKELRHLQLKEEVLKKEKELLSTLASHASQVQSVKVGINRRLSRGGLTICSLAPVFIWGPCTCMHVIYMHVCVHICVHIHTRTLHTYTCMHTNTTRMHTHIINYNKL